MALRKLDTGGIFEDSTTTDYDEATDFDGHNHISCATGTQWDHETLMVTQSGTPIIWRHSQRQGARCSFREIEPSEAAEWLAANGHGGALMDHETPAGRHFGLAVADLLR